MLACLALLRALAFEDLRLHRLFTETWGFRTAHMENLEAAGFRREGTCREHLRVDGQRQDVVFHGLLRSDDVG
jgi:RimJ/RimL family protein N-acetyltransferase